MPEAKSSNPAGVNPWIIAIAVMLSTFLEVLDTSVVNVSLPHIAGSLSATVDEATWVLTSYLVANAIVLPITGWLSNYFGRKRLLMTAVTGFTLASFLCGIAPSLPLLVFFRILQGASGGCLQPISQAVLLETFPPEQRGKAMAFWGMGIVVAPILGPTLGGWLTYNYTWRWVFYINLPIGIASLVMTHLYVFDPSYIRRQRDAGVDFWGLGLLAVGIGALQIMLDKGQQDDWFGSHFIVTLAILAGVGLTAFVIRELLARDPIVHLRVFKNRTYSTGVMLMTMLGFVLYGSLVLLPLFLQTLLGYTAMAAGIWTSPRGLGSMIFMPITGILLTRRWDARLLLTWGFLVASGALYMFSRFNLVSGTWNIFWPQLIQGAGMAFVFVPLTTVTMDPVPNEEMGNATSMFNLMRNLGGSLGISYATTLIARRSQFHQTRLASRINLYHGATQRALAGTQSLLMSRGASAPVAHRQALALLYGLLRQQASLLSYLDGFWLFAMVFLVMTPLVWLMRRPRSSRAVAAH